jgi:hypothetical protein
MVSAGRHPIAARSAYTLSDQTRRTALQRGRDADNPRAAGSEARDHGNEIVEKNLEFDWRLSRIGIKALKLRCCI